MNCLTQLVGLTGCDESTEPYLLNQLGLSKNQLEELLDDSYSTVDEWFDAMKSFSAKQLATDVVSSVATSVSVDTVVENGTIGVYAQNKVVTTADNYAGIYFDLWNQSEYVKLQISKLSFFGNHDGDIAIKFIDLTTDEELAEKTITAEAGKAIDISVDLSFKSAMKSLKLAVVYDASSINSYKTTVSSSGCSGCGNSYGHRSQIASVSAINIESPFLYSSKSSRNDTAGLSVDYAWVCDQEGWACAISGSLGLAYLYKVGYEMLAYSLNSNSQFSGQQTTNYEQNKERMTFFEYKYGQELSKVLKNARTPDSICFRCTPQVQVRTVMPG